jgi:hypothetical protein
LLDFTFDPKALRISTDEPAPGALSLVLPDDR